MENNNGKRRSGILFYLFFMILLLGAAMLFERCYNPINAVSYTEYREALEAGTIEKARISQNKQTPTGQVYYLPEDADEKAGYLVVNVSDVNQEQAALLEKGIDISLEDVQTDSILLTTILPVVLGIIGVIFILSFMTRGAGGGQMSQMQNFTKSRAKMSDPASNSVTFKDVAGLVEEKEELEEVVDFLKNPAKYTELGARIPKGMILVGPPGTGKTLLAKAVAGEAKVPFFSISGSDFVEMFVGVGASRVRDLFTDAKKNAPCIVFIDEIDAVGRVRGSGMGGGHDEREQTLNQLLVEMDGFSVNQGIIVMAATNRVDILDPAILRPGRFDRKVAVGYPDIKGREDILKVHSRNKKLGDDVDLHTVARTTAGFTGADLENLMNEAAISAARENRKFVTRKDIEDAFVKVGIGKEKKSKVISEKEKRITAYHEMGHAILFEMLPDVGPVHTISIIPTGLGAAGYTMPLPEEEEMFNTRGKMLSSIKVSMGGRIAEEIAFDDITTGASQDIKQATEIARNMVMKYGMSDRIGFINYEQSEDSVFLGRDLGHVKNYGDQIYNAIESEVKRIIDECYAEAKAVILSKRDVLDRGAALLIEREKLLKEEVEALFTEETENESAD